MGKRILVPVDESEQAREAGAFVAREYPDATMVLLHVINPADAGYSAASSIPSLAEQWYERERERAETLFDDLEDAIPVEPGAAEREIEVGRPTDVIVTYATEQPVDQIVMGSHGRSGVSRILLGSVAERVVRSAPVPVTVVR